VDSRADIYALGVLAFELLTGRRPFQADNALALMLKHLTDPVPDPRLINASLSEAVADCLRRCLAKQPDERYATAEAFLTTLHAAHSGLARPSIPNDVPTAEWPALTPSATHSPTQGAPAPLPSPSRPVQQPASTDRPPDQRPIPANAVFVGRESEKAFFTAALQQRHLAVISGMPGIGKTALAVELARQWPEKANVFWYTFPANEGVQGLIWWMAGFLWWCGQRDLWDLIHRTTQSGAQLTPTACFGYLTGMVRGHGYLLCFDDLHLLADSALDEFLSDLLPALEAGEVNLCLTSQGLPHFVAEGEFEPLAGLSVADVEKLLKERRVAQAEDLAPALRAATDGNARLVTLAADALKNQHDPLKLLHRLGESTRIEEFLTKTIDASLTAEEREVFRALAMLGDYPGTREAVSAILDGASVNAPLRQLTRRSLIRASDDEFDPEYSLAPVVRTYYYTQLHQRDRLAGHLHAAQYYTDQQLDAFRSAQHYQKGGEPAKGIAQLIEELWTILNRGQAAALRQLLEQYTSQTLNPPAWGAVLWARGQTLALLGDNETARIAYEAAFKTFSTLLTRPEHKEWLARICRGLAEVWQDDAPQTALEWIECGLAALPNDASLHIRRGRILVYQGKLAEAEPELKHGLDLLPAGPSRWRNIALINLGNVAYFRGDYASALERHEQAATAASNLGDFWFVTETTLNIGLVQKLNGQWPEALETQRASLKRAELYGAVQQQFRALLELGELAFKSGELTLAETDWTHARQLALAKKWQADRIYVNNGLVELHLEQGQLVEAGRLLAESEPLAQATGAVEPLPDLYRLRSSLHLQLGEVAGAVADAQQAIQSAQAQEAVVFEGTASRALAQAQWQANDYAIAQESFARSLSLLEKTDPYEAARTQHAWGQALLTIDRARGEVLLRDALTIFEKLGAQRDAQRARADLE